MKIQILGLSFASLLALSAWAAPNANAQFRVGVSNTIKNTTGTTKTIQDLTIEEKAASETKTTVEGNTQTLKIESYGENASAWLTFKDGVFKGGADASTNTPVDPVVIGIYSNYDETLVKTASDSSLVKGTVKSETNGYFDELNIDASSYLQ